MASRLMRSIARLVGAEYRVSRCDEPHLAPANALCHGRPRVPFVSRLPRVPGRGRSRGGRRRHFLPSLYESISPVQMRLYALFRLALMYSCISITVIHSSRSWLPSGVAHSAVRAMVPPIFPCGTARGHRTTPCAFSSARWLNRLMARCTRRGRRRVELVGPPRNCHEPRFLVLS